MKNMKKKKTSKVIIIIIVAILLATIIIFTLNLINDQKITKKNMQSIKESYQQLSENIVNYNQIRSSLSEKLNNFMYESYQKEHEEYVDLLTKYNNNIINIDQNIAILDDKCQVIYKDLSINKICDEYSLIYEKLINLYVSDLNNYNNKIASYNEYKEDKYNLFELIHDDYIDYNNDKVYEGIE